MNYIGKDIANPLKELKKERNRKLRKEVLILACDLLALVGLMFVGFLWLLVL